MLCSQKGDNYFGIQSGINYNMTYTNESINATHHFKHGCIVGLNYEKDVSSKWSLNFELNRTENKSTIENYSTFSYNSQVGITATTIGKVEFHEENNQFMIGFKRYFTESRRMFLELGWDIKFLHENIGQWNYQLTTIYNTSDIFNPILLDEPEVRTINSSYFRNGGYLGMNIGIGYKLQVGEKLRILCKGRFSNQIKKPEESGGIILRNVEALIGLQYVVKGHSRNK